MVIGVDETLPGHTLFRVVGAMRLADGRLVIGNGGSSELLLFDPAGSLISRVGGMGSGPEEFQGVQLVGKLPGDSILVLTNDPAIATVAPTGNVIAKEPYQFPFRVLNCRFAGACDMSILPDGSMLVTAHENATRGCSPMPEGTHRPGVLLGRYNWRAGIIDTLALFTGIDRSGPEYRVYGRYFVTAVSQTRLFAAETGGDSIAVFTHSGERAGTWTVPLKPTPVSAAAKSVVAPNPREQPDGSVHTFEPYDYPDVYPTFARIVADASGNLWVMKYPAFMAPTASVQLVCLYSPAIPDAGSDWLVLNPDGERVAEVHTPPGLFVLEIGDDYLLGVRRDSLDVETVALYPLHKPR